MLSYCFHGFARFFLVKFFPVVATLEFWFFSGSPSTIMGETVDRIIPSPRPSQPEKAQIAVDRADHRHRDLRIENSLTDEHGDEVKLKKKALTLRLPLLPNQKPSSATIHKVHMAHPPRAALFSVGQLGGIRGHEAQHLLTFNCASTSSAMVTTSGSNLLNSKLFTLLCSVEKMVTCSRRDSSTAIATV
jgi:hypothetical protein